MIWSKAVVENGLNTNRLLYLCFLKCGIPIVLLEYTIKEEM